MPRTIDYYFSLHSPWTYLGHATFLDIVARHGGRIVYRPVPLRAVFDETGGLPLPKRHPVRQRYRLMDLQRWRERRGVKLMLQPKHFPFDPSLADRFLIAIVSAGGDPGRFMGEIMAGVWSRDEDMTQPGAVARVARSCGFDAQALALAADSEAVVQSYEGTIAAAIAAGVFGAPSYVLDGEVFWGQDRLELLDSALASGRAPYRPDPAA
ncbi:2-hydroxychromene-2-carboxylate isomerase [Bosea sp. (in: a-proteobacteria)]|jgi:2-hydroxychromene-2-carboxylate isomerase|uniref:2-hydroxychromene-2-carboxylate isomerase n=1 Tax=Bosea sp. (in: a-proteobacteria) TaxID=1871050 RepID=UPI000AC82EE3|nr:2-hydroxychromene-2-carboxylate isomerase [Bosea sp. (in: a-proteobacteria)]